MHIWHQQAAETEGVLSSLHRWGSSFKVWATWGWCYRVSSAFKNHSDRHASTTAEGDLRNNLASSTPSTLGQALFFARSIPMPVVVSTLTINMLGLALPLVVLQIYDRVLTNRSMDTLAWLMAGLAGVIICEIVLKFFRQYLLSFMASRAAYEGEAIGVAGFLDAPSQYIDQHGSGVWIRCFEAQEQCSTFQGSSSRLSLLDVPFTVIYLIVAWCVAGTLVLVPLAAMAILGIYLARKAGSLREILMMRAKQDHRRYEFIAETLTLINTVKSMAMEPQILRRMERLQRSSAVVAFDKNLLSNELNSMTSFMTNVILISLVTTGATLVISGALTVGALACSTMLVSRVVQALVRSIPAYLEFEQVKFAQKRADKLPTGTLRETKRSVGSIPAPLSISLENIVFKYSSDEKPVLKISSLEIRAGEIIGLRGETSSGKSTLFSILSGNVTPELGCISVGKHDGSAHLPSAVLGAIRYVGCTPIVFQGTILENLTMFRAGASIQAARHAAGLIDLETDINRLPKGYDTRLGDGVSNSLSEGLLQRITIARALATQPGILLLDEANSLLDLPSDTALRQGLQSLKGKQTVVIASNRPSMLAVADRLFEMRDGILVEITARQSTPPTSNCVA